jgi:PRC-barrel domain
VRITSKKALAAIALVMCSAGPQCLLAAGGPERIAQSVDQPAALDAPPADAPKGTPATVVDDQQVAAILGKSVRSKDNEDMGRVVDILVTRGGRVRAAVIDFGGFLGVGSRKVAVDWNALHFASTGRPDRITLELTRDQVRVAPEYKPGEPVVVLGAPSDAAEPKAAQPTPPPER